MKAATPWYDVPTLRDDVAGTVRPLAGRQVSVIYGRTSAEDATYMDLKSPESWSVHDVISGLAAIDVEATWLDPTQPNFPEAVSQYDAAFVNAHGRYGEDGSLQGFLMHLGVPFTGCAVVVSAVGADKRLAKAVAAQAGLATPAFERLRGTQTSLAFPLMIKGVDGGSSIGIELVRSGLEFADAIGRLTRAGFTDLIVESFIEGLPVTVSALRVGPTLVLLPPLVCAPERTYYDRSAKLESAEATYRVLEQDEPLVASLLGAADTLAADLDFDGAVRIDFVVAEGEPYFLEINTTPGMQRRSNFALSAEAAGIDYPMLLGAVLSSAFSSRKVVPWRTPTTSHSFASTVEGRSL